MPSPVGLGNRLESRGGLAGRASWSDEDGCFVGSCPGPFYGGCHGDDEKAVFAELCDIAEETIELYRKDDKPLPPPTSVRDYANKMLSIAS